MFNPKVASLRAAICWLLLGSLTATADIEIKQSKQALEIRTSKFALNLVPGSEGAVLSSRLNDHFQYAATLGAKQSSGAASIIRTIKLVENTPVQAAAEVEYAFNGSSSVFVVYTVKDNSEYIEAESDFARGQAFLAIMMKSEAMILPDLLADSMAFYPESAPAAIMNIPVDNHLLVNLLDRGSAMLTLLWDSNKLNICEAGEDHFFNSVTLSSDAKTKLWIGIIAAKGIWYKTTEKLNPVNFTALNWNPPFQAEWKMMTFLENGFYADTPTCESWVLNVRDGKNKDFGAGIGVLNPDAWQFWVSGLGGFNYPCYFQDEKTFAKQLVLSIEVPPVVSSTPPLIYTLKSNRRTPLEITGLPINAMQKLLPRELNSTLVAVIDSKDRYPATCGITEKIEKIFYRSESSKEKKQIENSLAQMNLFVLTVRERIEDYVAWQHKMNYMLNKYRQQNPQFASTIDSVKQELSSIVFLYAKAKDQIKTPLYCSTLTEKIIDLADAKLSDEEKEDQCKNLGRQIRSIGGGQDELVAKFRYVVKAVRQDVTRKLMMATTMKERFLLENVRAETGIILKSRFRMEGK